MIFENRIIAPLSEILQCFTQYKVHMHAGAIRKLLYGLVVCVREIIHSNHSPHKPYKNLHLNVVIEQATISIRKRVYISV